MVNQKRNFLRNINHSFVRQRVPVGTGRLRRKRRNVFLGVWGLLDSPPKRVRPQIENLDPSEDSVAHNVLTLKVFMELHHYS